MTVTDITTLRLMDGDYIVIAHIQGGKSVARAFAVLSDGNFEERALTPSDRAILKALTPKMHTAKRED
jgi:hypothetical protein